MAISKFHANKLVRDNILDILQQKNIICKHKILNNEQYIEALKDKVIEEALEVKEGSKTLEEICDVLEVVECLIKAMNVSYSEILYMMYKKREEKGSFDKKIFCESVEMDETNPAIAKYLSKPQQYPEIK